MSPPPIAPTAMYATVGRLRLKKDTGGDPEYLNISSDIAI